MKIFIGTDKRQPVAYNVLRYSIEAQASKPVDIQPLRIEWMPVQRTGLTEFSFTRYLVPFLCGYQGKALFIDADMLCRADIWDIPKLCDSQYRAVCVVKNKIRFEWPSLMYYDNERCKSLTPELVAHGTPQDLKWADGVGELPAEYNHIVGYDTPREDARIVHFTRGIPVWRETIGCEYAEDWKKWFGAMNSTCGFQELMGRSVHAQRVTA